MTQPRRPRRPRRRGRAGGGAAASRTLPHPQRLLQGRRRARDPLHRAARPRHLHDRRQPRDRSGDDACRRSRSRPSSTAASRACSTKNMPVTIEADIKNTYTPNPPMFNVVGEIPGTDKADEVVMLGAHFDSWHAVDRRDRQRRRLGRDDGSDAHPQAERREAAPHRAHRPVDRRRAGADRLARLRDAHFGGCPPAAALPRAPARRRRRGGPAGRGCQTGCSSSPSTRSSPATSTSTTAPARSAASTCSRTTPSRRSSASGWSRSAASA